MRLRRYPRRLLSVVFAASGLLVLMTSCEPDKGPVSETWLSMGTFASVHVAWTERNDLARHAAESRHALAELEQLLSIYRPESEISRLNRAGALTPIHLSVHTACVLEHATNYARITGGAFDPTVAPLVRMWGFSGGRVPHILPDAATIESNRQIVGWTHLIVSNRMAMFDIGGMSVDLGGIAKGYAVDVCYERLLQTGVKNFMVNLGGNIRCAGEARPRVPWKIGVRNPFETDRIVGTLVMSDGMAVATSGNYERFVEIGGQRYAHIIDPRTGFPVRGMAAVVAVCPTATQTDALSTALFVLGVEEGAKLVAQLGDCDALFIPDELPLRILVTPGFLRYFTPSKEHARAMELVSARTGVQKTH